VEIRISADNIDGSIYQLVSTVYPFYHVIFFRAVGLFGYAEFKLYLKEV